MLSHEQKQHFQAKRREGSAHFASKLRHDLEGRISWLYNTSATEEQKRDMRRLWDLMNDICAKHQRKSERM